jgi:signal transduction histidine kinase/CheY-like chemotaxis protein
MTAETLALFPAVAAAISVINGVYAFLRRKSRGAMYFFLMPLGTAIWSIGYSAELLAPSQSSMTAMDNLEFIGSDLVVIGFFLFAWHYTKGSRPPLWLLLFPAVNQVFAWTDSGLLRVNPAVREMGAARFLTYDYGLWMWFNIVVYYSLLLTAGWLFALRLRTTHGIFRRQVLLLLASGMIPWAASTFTVFGLLPLPIPNLDTSPLTLAAGNGLLTAALFWSGTLRIAPLARERTFDWMEDGVIVTDTSGAIVDYNYSAKKFLSGIVELSVGDPVPPLLLSGEREIDAGKGFWMHVHTNKLMQDHQTVGTIYTLHDVTEDKQAQEALQDATAHAVQASKAKSTFLANMSHEIRTPLTAILGIAEILQDSDLNSDQRKMVQAFQNAGENLLAMINDLLDLSRIEAGKMPLVPRDFSAGELLSSICQLFRMKIASPSGNVQLNLQLDSSLPSRLRADDFRLSQILTNLIGNAVKFTAKGSIDVSASYADGLLEVTVEDTGPGIPGDRIEAVFTAFEQADASATRAFGGTGLGLAIVRELVRLMGGSVSVSSEPGKGSRFTVRLPAGAALAELSPESRPTPSQIELRHGGLLVAEDTEVIRTILIRHLTAIGVPAIFVENGKEAVAEFTHSHFDAVLLDIQMPVMDGFEAARIIRALERAEGRKKTPLIALSASAMPDDVVKAKQAGFDLHIAKPVSRIQLQQALQQALG